MRKALITRSGCCCRFRGGCYGWSSFRGRCGGIGGSCNYRRPQVSIFREAELLSLPSATGSAGVAGTAGVSEAAASSLFLRATAATVGATVAAGSGGEFCSVKTSPGNISNINSWISYYCPIVQLNSTVQSTFNISLNVTCLIKYNTLET